jgi:hypothetical protein
MPAKCVFARRCLSRVSSCFTSSLQTIAYTKMRYQTSHIFGKQTKYFLKICEEKNVKNTLQSNVTTFLRK